MTDAVFRAEMWRRVGRTDAALPTTAAFLPHIKLPTTVTVTTLLLFGHVTLN